MRLRRAVVITASCAMLVASVLGGAPAFADADAPVIVDVPTTGTTTGVAIDDDTVVTGEAPAVDVRDVSFDAGTVGTVTKVASNFFPPCSSSTRLTDYYTGAAAQCSGLAEADGVTAWSYLNTYAGETTLSGPAARTANLKTTTVNVTAVDQNWILLAGQSLANTTTGTVQLLSNNGGVDLTGGNLYLPGAIELSTQSSVIVRNLSTGAAGLVSVPECKTVQEVQAAGSWLLAECVLTSGSESYVIVDRTGAQADRELPITGDQLLLGNGFLAERLADSTLQWASLGDANLTWSTIGTTASDLGHFAVSKQSVPSLAWIDTAGAVHAALLPVIASAPPADPTGSTSVPAAPVPTAQGWSDHVSITWADPPSGENLTGYLLRPPGKQAILLPPTARGYTLTNVPSGEQYSFLAAENANGDSTAVEFQTSLQNPYPNSIVNPTAVFDDTNGNINVTWGWTQDAQSDAPTSFDVSAGPYSKTGLDPSTRSVTLSTAEVFEGETVTITAHGPRANSSWTIETSFPGTWIAPGPDVAVTGLQPVTLGTTIAADFTATRGGATIPVDVRMQTAARNGTAGAWTEPTDWQAVSGTASINLTNLTPGSSYCFEDRASNVDGTADTDYAWSAPTCTAVAIDDRALTRVGSWTRSSNAEYFDGTISTSANKSSKLKVSIHSKQIWIIATTCPTCGNVGMKIGNTTMWMSLHSATTQYQVPIWVPWGRAIHTTIEIVQRTSGKHIHIDGVAELGY